MEQKTGERIAGLEMQIIIFKWAVGGFCILMMMVSGSLVKWTYAQGSDMNVLRTQLNTQKQITQKHEGKIDKSASNVGKMGKDIQANTIHLQNIKEMVKEISSILKGQRK